MMITWTVTGTETFTKDHAFSIDMSERDSGKKTKNRTGRLEEKERTEA